MEAPKPFGHLECNEKRGGLGVAWCGQKSDRYLLLPSVCGAKTHYELAERRIGMIEVRLLERDKLVGEVTRNEPVRVAILLEMGSLRRPEVCRNSVAASIIKLLLPDLRFATYGGREAKIRLGAINATNPKAGRRIAFPDVSTPEKAVDSRPDL